jgi:putative ABC transport system permease protein
MRAAEPGRWGKRAGDGGMPARRAVVRWAWRLFRREWRQQILVLALLTVATGATIVTAATAYNLAPAEDDARFGTANYRLRFRAQDSNQFDAVVAAARDHFGRIDVYTHHDVNVPGSVESVEFRDQAPDGAFSEPMLALREGRYPTSDSEVAVTDGLAKTYNLRIGDSFNVGGAWTVVGVVENPSDLNAEFALLVHGALDAPEALTILVNADESEVRSFQPPGENLSMEIGERAASEQFIASASVLLIATVVLVFVSLIAATGFIVLAQRRLRQLGMLAAIGATEKHVRLVMVANGAVIGALAATLGIVIGLAIWIAMVPLLEDAAAHRIDALNVAWWLIGASALLSVAAATLAAWWPARSIARVPITMALSGRPPRPRPTRRSFGLATLLILAGVACLALLDPAEADPADGSFGRLDQILLIVGTVATVGGVLFLSPLALSLLGSAAGRLPIALRLALRDLARYRSRSGAALAAISLAIGIAAAIAIAANADAEAAVEENLSDSQLLVWTRSSDGPEDMAPTYTGNPEGWSPFLPNLSADELAELQVQADRIAAMFEDGTITTLDVAIDPAVPQEAGAPGRTGVTLVQGTADASPAVPGTTFADASLVYVATPELLEQYGLDLATIDADVDVITVPPSELLPRKFFEQLQGEDLWFSVVFDPRSGRSITEPIANVEELTQGYTGLPATFITPEKLASLGWESVRVGWLIETAAPITPEQLEAAREIAASAGLYVEARNEQPSNGPLRSGATAAGILVALSVLAMTVGLIRSEASGDLRTLTAVGATGTIRRTLTAATAAALALLGALLGILGAYLVLAAGYFGDPAGSLVPVPVFNLLMIALGAPIAAAVAGWLLAGRQPPTLARQPIE